MFWRRRKREKDREGGKLNKEEILGSGRSVHDYIYSDLLQDLKGKRLSALGYQHKGS